MKSNHHGLKIQDHTYNNVQDPMYFNGNFSNTNLAKLKEVVDYAKSQGWSMAHSLIQTLTMPLKLYSDRTILGMEMGHGTHVAGIVGKREN